MQASRRCRIYSRNVILAGLLLGLMFQTQANAVPDRATCSQRTSDTDASLSTRLRIETRRRQRILIVEGTIDRGASERLASYIPGFLPIDEIWFNSPGGDAQQGLEMGKVIRHFGIPTRIPSGWHCISACSMAFLGGPVRRIDGGAAYAVHVFHRMNAGMMGDSDLEQKTALDATQQADYLIRMGVSRKLLSDVMYTQDHGTERCLTREEEQVYNVVNVSD